MSRSPSPKEGTILTVLRHTAEEFKRLALSGEKYQVIFEKAIIKAREILEKTRDILPQMKKAHVVDAGGMGFYLFFKGMAAAVQGRGFEAGEAGSAVFDQKPLAVDASELAFCAEWVLRPIGQGRDFFKDLLAAHGDSLLIAGAADLLHLHIHTDDPDAVEKELARHGEIVSRKVDSLRQPEEPGREIAVALPMDSAVDIPEPTEKTMGITVVPLQILLNDRFVRDRFEIGKEELYRRMRAEKDLVVKTSQPAPPDFTDAFDCGPGPQATGAFFQPFLAPERLVPERAGSGAPVAGDRPGQDPHHRYAQCLGRQRAAPLPRPEAPAPGVGPRAGRGRGSRPSAATWFRWAMSNPWNTRSAAAACRRLAGAITRLLGIRPLVAFENGKLVKKGASAQRPQQGKEAGAPLPEETGPGQVLCAGGRVYR